MTMPQQKPSSACSRRSHSAPGAMESIDEVEFATLDWMSGYNEKRLYGPLGHIPPVEFEQMYYQNQSGLVGAGLN